MSTIIIGILFAVSIILAILFLLTIWYVERIQQLYQCSVCKKYKWFGKWQEEKPFRSENVSSGFCPECLAEYKRINELEDIC